MCFKSKPYFLTDTAGKVMHNGENYPPQRSRDLPVGIRLRVNITQRSLHFRNENPTVNGSGEIIILYEFTFVNISNLFLWNFTFQHYAA